MEYYTLKAKDKENTSYNQIADGFLQEKKSKFISYLFAINNEDMALEYINNIKKDNKEARHVVYIYSYIEDNNVKIKFSDDGEPQGTGTRAIYDMLQKENITNICIVIVRYFGGILLGAGPLSRAYLNSAKDAFLKCNKTEIYNYTSYTFNLEYNCFDTIKYIISTYKENEVIIKDTKYNDDIIITVDVIDRLLNDFKNKIDKYIKYN